MGEVVVGALVEGTPVTGDDVVGELVGALVTPAF